MIFTLHPVLTAMVPSTATMARIFRADGTVEGIESDSDDDNASTALVVHASHQDNTTRTAE